MADEPSARGTMGLAIVAMLLIDGRLEAIATTTPGTDLEALIEATLELQC